MSDPVRWTGQMPSAPNQAGGRAPATQGGGDGTNLADILERVLDKGIVIAGDVQINLLDIELLTIKLRLVVASVDRAKEMGIDWWERDPTLSSGHNELEQENRRLRERLEALEGGAGPTALEDGALVEDDGEVEDEPADVVDEDDLADADDLDDDELADDELADDELADDELADDELADDELADDEPAEEDEPEPVRRKPRGRSTGTSAPRRRDGGREAGGRKAGGRGTVGREDGR